MSNPIDLYIEEQRAEIQEKLRDLQQMIMEVEPSFEQKIAWGMPTFRKRVNQIHFAAHKKHVGIYPGVAAMEGFAERLKSYKSSKGAFQIPYERETDKELIQDIVRFNLQLNWSKIDKKYPD